ncbi:hypothetical protein VM1G_08886 [Cytospora mali]|uniref:Uncharacterized protein n=1 Tax=Cytospora mali TaxID=578113 RepID=A0A194W9D2_CYTMA|nr:hypothetical protein VM1G_08886 [Valsa mali]
MARPQNTKRQHEVDGSEEEPPQKTRSMRERRTPWNYPPSFCDKSLQGLPHARRNSIAPQPETSVPAGEYARDIVRFASRERKSSPETTASRSSASSSSQRPRSTKGPTLTSRRPSAKNNDFEQHINDHDIYLNDRRSKAQKIDEIRDCLWRRRSSLSASQFSDGNFDIFQSTNEDALRDDDQIRPLIIPSKHKNVPVACNCFLEAKRQDGSAAAMKRQACYDGAYGARAMHSLQNYGEEEPVYDGKARTFSSTYHAGTGTLQLYSHHVTTPATPGGRPEYHMTQVRSFGMTDTLETFVEGEKAFRNAQDLARDHRDEFIQTAYAKARREASATSDILTSTAAM